MSICKQSEVDERIAEHVAFRLNPKTWRGNDQQEYIVRLMSDQHLRHVIRMIEDGRMAKAGRYIHKGMNMEAWARIFNNELLVRRLEK